MLGRAYRALLDSPLASTMRSGLQLRPGYRATPADRQAADQAEARTGETGQPVILLTSLDTPQSLVQAHAGAMSLGGSNQNLNEQAK